MTTTIRLGDLLANQNRFIEALAEYEKGIKVLNLSAEELAKDRAVAEARFMMAKVILYQNGDNREARALQQLFLALNTIVRHLEEASSVKYPLIDYDFMAKNDHSIFLVQVGDNDSTKQLKEIVLDVLNEIEDVIDQQKHEAERIRLKEQELAENKAIEEQVNGFSSVPSDLPKTSICLGNFGNASRRNAVEGGEQGSKLLEHSPKKLPD